MSSTNWNELDGYEALVSELRATAPAAPDSLRQRVLEGGPTVRPQRSRKRRLTLVVVPVAVVLAVGAAFVHGFVSTGSRSSNAPAALAGRTSAAYGSVVHGANQYALPTDKATRALKERELAPDTSSNQALTQGKVFSAASDSLSAVASGQAAAAPLGVTRKALAIPRNRLVHAVASLEVRVRSRSQLSAKTNEASQIVGSFGGYAQSVRYQNSRNGYGESILELRVPVQKAEPAIGKLSALGALVSQQVSTQDLQAKLNQETSGIGSLQRAITVYVSALNSGTLSGSQRVIIQIKLNNARRQLSHLRHARTGTLASGATASISLLLTTRSHAVVVPHHHKQGRLGRLLGSAANFLGLEGIIVLYALIVLSPIVLIAALAWWIVRERRRREERLLASA
jgi:Domain of unknown function (DUF4349)